MRLDNESRDKIQAMAARLCIRESDMLRICITYTLERLSSLMDEENCGCDLLPIFLEIRSVLCGQFGFNKHQLYKIFNSGYTTPEKFVGMTDIELLLMSDDKLAHYLHRLDKNISQNDDIECLLKTYLLHKYKLDAVHMN